MRLIDGQHIWGYKDVKCGTCNVPYISNDELFNFQLKSSVKSNFYLNEFDNNFFKEITGTSISFEESANFTDTILYVCGKVFRFIRTTTEYPLPNSYNITTNGNIITIEYYYFYYPSSLLNALIATIDSQCGTTSTYNSGIYTISGIPANSYINNHNGQWINITNISPFIADDASSFILNYSKICYYGHISVPTNFYEIRPGSLAAGTQYKICFDYTAEYDDFTANIVIEDGVNITTIPISIVSGSMNVCAYYTALLSNNHTIRIELTDANKHYKGFCIDNLSIDEMCNIGNITIKHIDGAFQIPFNGVSNNIDINYHNDNILVQLDMSMFLANYIPNAGIDACFQMTIIDNCGNEIKTNIFKIYHEKCNALIKVDWFSDCKFMDLDYLNLPFVNTLYVDGYKRKQPSVSKNRISNIGFDNSVKTIYSHILVRYELNTTAYDEYVHNALEKAFLHEHTLVDDVEYTTDTGDLYIIREIRDDVYAGRIDIIESSVVSSNCCC